MENNRNLLALKPDQVVDVLVKSGCRNMTLELLHSDFDAGAPRCGSVRRESRVAVEGTRRKIVWDARSDIDFTIYQKSHNFL